MSLCQNGAPPMFLDWINLTVTSDQNAINRGVQVATGTPPQLFSLFANYCYNDSCVGFYGGVYNYQASSTFRRTIETQWNGTYEPDPGDLAFIYFNDVLHSGNAAMCGYPLFMDQPGYGGQGVLALGWNSLFLRSAFSTGAVPSQAFGLWPGSRSINHPVDGSVVIGGYDSTRFDPSQLTDFKSNSECTTSVVVTGLTYNTNNGSTSLFSNTSESLEVSLDPYYRILQVPQDIYDNFAKASSGTYDPNLVNLRYSADTPPTGNITVTLGNGYVTTIPTEELFVEPRHYNNLGQYSIANNTVLISEIVNITIGNTIVNWGISYLTMNYLIADYARSKFQLAPAIRTDFTAEGGGYELEAICDPAVPTPTSASTLTSTHSTTTSPTPLPSLGPMSKSSNTGAILGGELGLALILGVLALLFYRNRKRNNLAAQQQVRDEISQLGSLSDAFHIAPAPHRAAGMSCRPRRRRHRR